ncbi:hypothetical protein A0256_10400 [Mucilaginibacter sp. PAMC 26640]|nr:hypothetical protein A0256_10400 [Mucilaginibacter sp. PAMC 26640]
MNDTFNLTRFGLLLKKSVLERAMQILGLMAFVLCFTLISYSILVYIGGWVGAQTMSFVWGFIGGGVFLSSMVFSYFNTNAGGSAYLTLPASALEKWLCGVLLTGVFFCLIFFGFYRLIDYCFVTAYHNGLDRNSPLYKNMYNAVYIFPFEGNIVRQSTTLFLNFTGIMLVGQLYFNKVALVKVALVTCAIMGFIYFLNLAVATMLLGKIDIAFPYYTVLINMGSEVGNVELPEGVVAVPNAFFQYILPVILWLTAYIRLREKEI